MKKLKTVLILIIIMTGSYIMGYSQGQYDNCMPMYTQQQER